MQTDPFLEKSMEYLQDRVAALSMEQSRIQYQIKSMRAIRRVSLLFLFFFLLLVKILKF
jgi:hypothetical protein